MELVRSSLLKGTVAAALLIVLGVLVGLQMDDSRTGFLEDQLRQTNLQTETFLVSNTYLQESSQNYCSVVETQIPSLARQNAQIGRDLQSFSSKSISHRSDYDFIKQNYYVNQLKLYNMLRSYRERCSSNATLIFFFFDDSAASQRQGSVLTEYRNKVNNRTYVFSYNLEADDSQVLQMLETDYNVTDGPTTVINGNRTYRRYVSLKELKTVLS